MQTERHRGHPQNQDQGCAGPITPVRLERRARPPGIDLRLTYRRRRDLPFHWRCHRRCLPTVHQHRRHKPVSAARYGRDIVWGLGIIVERFPHFADRDPQAVVEFHESVFRPQALSHFLPGDDLARSLNQHQQQPVRQVLQPHSDPATRKSAFLRVQLEGAEAVASHFCRHSCPPFSS